MSSVILIHLRRKMNETFPHIQQKASVGSASAHQDTGIATHVTPVGGAT